MADEVSRRLVHVTGAAVPLAHLLRPDLITWRVVQGFLAVALVVVLILEAVRLTTGLDWVVYDRLTREYEQDNPAGYALYIVGIAIVAFAVELPSMTETVAVPAMLMLAIGDPISGLLGSADASNVKQAWVLLVMFGVCTLLAAPFVPPPPQCLAVSLRRSPTASSRVSPATSSTTTSRFRCSGRWRCGSASSTCPASASKAVRSLSPRYLNP